MNMEKEICKTNYESAPFSLCCSTTETQSFFNRQTDSGTLINVNHAQALTSETNELVFHGVSLPLSPPSTDIDEAC